MSQQLPKRELLPLPNLADNDYDLPQDEVDATQIIENIIGQALESNSDISAWREIEDLLKTKNSQILMTDAFLRLLLQILKTKTQTMEMQNLLCSVSFCLISKF